MNLNRWFKLSDGTLAFARGARLDGREVMQVALRSPDGSERVECWPLFERRTATPATITDHRAWKLANLLRRIATSNVKAERAEARRRMKRAGWRASRPKTKVA